MTAYGTSKLMTIMSNIEMVKRLQGSGIDSFICQPGMSSTPVYGKTDKSHVMANVLDAAQKVLGQTEERGAVPLLYAATAPEVSGRTSGMVLWPAAAATDYTVTSNAGLNKAMQVALMISHVTLDQLAQEL